MESEIQHLERELVEKERELEEWHKKIHLKTDIMRSRKSENR